MHIGFKQTIISPKLPCKLAGYAKKRTANTIHDDLYVKVLVFEQDKAYIAILAYDLLAVDHLLMDAVTVKCREQAVPIDRLFFSAIHTHSGPGGILDSEHGFLKGVKELFGDIDDAYIEYIAEQSVSALKDALSDLQEGNIETAYGKCDGIGSNRNNQKLPGNSSLWIAKAETKTQKALIVNFACHPTILKADNLSVSSDFCGAYAQAMKENGFAMCMFLNGSCGDISSRFIRHGSDFEEVERMGNRLAVATVALLKKMEPWQGNAFADASFTIQLQGKQAKSIEAAKAHLDKCRNDLGLAKKQNIAPQKLRLIENAAEGAMADYLYSLHYDGCMQYAVTVEMLKIGEEIFIGIPGELFSELSNPFEDKHTHFISYLNGYHMYFANAYAYEHQLYEASSSPFAPNEGEKLMNRIEKQIRIWRNQNE